MSAETMDQELARLKLEIKALRQQKVGIAANVYAQWVQDAQGRIRQAAAKYGISLDNLNPVVTIVEAPPSPVVPPQGSTPAMPLNFPNVGDVVKVPATIEETAGASSCSAQHTGSTRWAECQKYEVNQDGKIDITDVATIAKHYGQHYL